MDRGCVGAVAPLGDPLALEDRRRAALKDAASIVGDTSDEEVPALAPGAPDAESIVGSEEAGDGAAVEPPPAGRVLPDRILGQTVRHIKGKHSGGWSYGPRISVKCRNLGHEKCSKSRSIEMDAEKYGPAAAAFFLEAWLSRSDLPVREHRRYAPSAAEVKAIADRQSNA